MLHRLAGRLTEVAQLLRRGGETPNAALHGTVYAIGDVHGESGKLHRLLERMKADSARRQGPITLVMLGDYINRGPHSAAVIHLLRQDFPSGWNTVFLRGNHEQELLKFLQNPARHSQWLGWGGLATCESYGVPLYANGRQRETAALAAELQHALQENGDLTWLQATQLMHQQGPYLFVHAGVRPQLPLSAQMPEDLLFIREDWLNRPHGLPHRVVFGHTIQAAPLVQDDRIGIDTGAFQGGPLTCAVLTANAEPEFIQEE